MAVLVVNAGSSTLKLRLVDDADTAEGADVDPWDGGDPTAALEALCRDVGSIDACGHRFVHGGADLTAPTVVDNAVRDRIAALAPRAPLHQARSLAALDAARRALPDVDHVACFDTAFPSTLTPAARTYALPEPWRRRWDLRRFGFHGISHRWAARRAGDLAAAGGDKRRVVTCHLGAGASLCAVLNGRSVDTTMGFTLLEGLVMATRSGSVDPGLVLWLLTDAHLDAAKILEGLEHHSGLAGLAGGIGDMRDVLAARAARDPAAALAFDVYVHRLAAGVAAMAAALGGLDVLAFTGGVGEHAPEVRAAAAARLGFLGVAVDPDANAATSADGDITGRDARTRTVVVSAREDLEVAGETRELLAAIKASEARP
ncbi:acetate/propionate family kinase [Actinomarinicola tropica]|uniref:Acetate kinase n=1 Tax=Actinomarinicola tropica TaxID=2789776 RepID=A0A5Q2RBA7_9ACTN|nr:acetate/propionate family kinase [Actinomarinicola tropica]QGG94108.1 acetate/propionate family kinase [Actinomarinicola tropica]